MPESLKYWGLVSVLAQEISNPLHMYFRTYEGAQKRASRYKIYSKMLGY